MSRFSRVLVGAVALALIALGPGLSAPPAKRAAPRTGVFKVQVRQPKWRPITVAPNRQAALGIKQNLVRQGFVVQLRANRAGQVAVRARMPRWHNRAVVNNRPQAQTLAHVLRSQGWQARVMGRGK